MCFCGPRTLRTNRSMIRLGRPLLSLKEEAWAIHKVLRWLNVHMFLNLDTGIFSQETFKAICNPYHKTVNTNNVSCQLFRMREDRKVHFFWVKYGNEETDKMRSSTQVGSSRKTQVFQNAELNFC